jgi:hypothetical protein
MAHAGNLMVVDEEFDKCGEELAHHRDFFCQVLMEYRDIMDYLTANMEGETSLAITQLVDQIRGLPSELLCVGGNFQTDCSSYVSETFAADDAAAAARLGVI